MELLVWEGDSHPECVDVEAQELKLLGWFEDTLLCVYHKAEGHQNLQGSSQVQ